MNHLNIDQKKLFLQLFYIFEKELLTIFEYVAPTKENFITYGNRIHELLLRIGAEVENIAKGVCYYIVKSKGEDNTWIEGAQSKDLLRYLNNVISIKQKAIQFNAGLELGLEQFITPFLDKKWRENYDNLKHGKIVNYSKCNLGNVINAFGGYYILLNYFILGYDNTLNCESIISFNLSKKLGIDSTIFSSSSTFDKESYSFYLLYGDNPIVDFDTAKKYDKGTKQIEAIKISNFPLAENEYLFCTRFESSSWISGFEYFSNGIIPNNVFDKKYKLNATFGFIN